MSSSAPDDDVGSLTENPKSPKAQRIAERLAVTRERNAHGSKVVQPCGLSHPFIGISTPSSMLVSHAKPLTAEDVRVEVERLKDLEETANRSDQKRQNLGHGADRGTRPGQRREMQSRMTHHPDPQSGRAHGTAVYGRE